MADAFMWIGGGFINPKHIRIIIGMDRPIDVDLDREGELPEQKYRVYISKMEAFDISYRELRPFINRNYVSVPFDESVEDWDYSD